jgi:hypothetical protein
MTKIVSSVIAGLEPATFWEHFEALTRIARPSRHGSRRLHTSTPGRRTRLRDEQDEGRKTGA